MAKFIDVKVKINVEPKKQALKNQIRAVEKLPEKATEYFKAMTPIDTGNARRNTKLKGDDTIHANYAYAQKLDDGHSRQASQGMTKPTEKWVREQFKKIFKK
jgi:hypothetical protein